MHGLVLKCTVLSNNAMQIVYGPVRHRYMKQNRSHGVEQLDTVHFGPCDLIFLLIPVYYDVV